MFMIAAPGSTASMKIDVPSGDWFDGFPLPNQQTFVSVERGNKLYIGDNPTSLETLAADVNSAVGPPRATKQSVMIRAGAHVPYGDFMIVMNTLKKAGYEPRLLMEDM